MARPRWDVAGGIAGLVWLLRNHCGAVEADLQRTYGLALTDFPHSLTWRRLAVLVRHLPRDSAVGRAVSGEAALWGVTDYLLANIADLLAGANWQRQNAGASSHSPKPDPVPRPGTDSKPKGLPSGALRDWARRHGQEAQR